MTTISDVRRGIAYAIQNGLVSASYPQGLRVEEYVRDTLTGPCAEVHRREFDPRLIFSEVKSEYQFVVRVYSPLTTDRWSQEFLDDLSEVNGQTSLIRAVQDGDNWPADVTIDYAQVTRVGEIVAVQREAEAYLMVEFDVEAVW